VVKEISKYLARTKSELTVTDDELKTFLDQGYAVLERESSYWAYQGIDFNLLDQVSEDLIKTKAKTTEPGALRVADLILEGSQFRKLCTLPDFLHVARNLLGDKIKLSSLDLREPEHKMGWQGLHMDWTQRSSNVAPYNQVAFLIILDDQFADNGPLRVVPKSHADYVHIKSNSLNKEKRTPQDHEVIERLDRDSAKKVIAQRGSIIMLNVNAFHGGTINESGKRRRVIFVSYRRKDLLGLEDHRRLTKVFVKKLNSIEKYLLELNFCGLEMRLRRFQHDNRRYMIVKIISKLFQL